MRISDWSSDVCSSDLATIRSIAGVYGAAYANDEGFMKIQQDIEAFAADEGRRPRMLVVKLGQDGHDRGAKVIATAFADLGRSEEHTSELQSLMRISYAVFCLKKKKKKQSNN